MLEERNRQKITSRTTQRETKNKKNGIRERKITIAINGNWNNMQTNQSYCRRENGQRRKGKAVFNCEYGNEMRG